MEKSLLSPELSGESRKKISASRIFWSLVAVAFGGGLIYTALSANFSFPAERFLARGALIFTGVILFHKGIKKAFCPR